MAALLVFAVLSLLSITTAEDRAHGLTNESPVAISPEAYAFFHPKATQPASSPTTMPLAATVKSTPAQENASTGSGRGLGAGGIAGISLSFLFVCLVGMGVYYVIVKRRANATEQQQQVDV